MGARSEEFGARRGELITQRAKMLKLASVLTICLFAQCSLLLAEPGLEFAVGEHGLDSLSFNGQSLLASPKAGELKPVQSLFRKVVDALLNSTDKAAATRNDQTGAIDLAYPWGSVSCAYSKKSNNVMEMRVQITNSSNEKIPDISLRLFELTFSTRPAGTILDAGMFGYGFKMQPWPMGNDNFIADPRFAPPIIQVSYPNGSLNYCSDDIESLVEITSCTNAAVKTSYPFLIGCRDIEPGVTKTVTVSL